MKGKWAKTPGHKQASHLNQNDHLMHSFFKNNNNYYYSLAVPGLIHDTQDL